MKKLLSSFLALSLALTLHSSCPCCHADADIAAAVEFSSDSLFQLPAKWTTDRGAEFSLAELQGRPVVITMFFSKCEYACPLLVNDMRRMRSALPTEVREKTRFVLVSFDVDHDGVEILRDYREAQGLDDGWILLSGSADDVRTLAAVLGVQYKKDSRGQFSHSNLITVLNPAGEIFQQQSGLNGDVTLLAAAASQVGK